MKKDNDNLIKKNLATNFKLTNSFTFKPSGNSLTLRKKTQTVCVQDGPALSQTRIDASPQFSNTITQYAIEACQKATESNAGLTKSVGQSEYGHSHDVT